MTAYSVSHILAVFSRYEVPEENAKCILMPALYAVCNKFSMFPRGDLLQWNAMFLIHTIARLFRVPPANLAEATQ